MAEQQHNTDPNEPHLPVITAPETDPAAKSLADALRVSFRLLGVIMIFVVIAFLMTGLETIEPQEKGIVKVFGKATRVAEPGLAYNWPFPIGEIEIVEVQEKSIEINDFWKAEARGERGKNLLDQKIRGLDIERDGTLLTGDRNLLHVRLGCNYVIKDPLICAMRIGDVEQALRSVICNVAIKAAAVQTADGIRRKEDEFHREVQQQAEVELAKLLGLAPTDPEAIAFTVTMPQKSVPQMALQADQRAQRAKQGMDAAINSAKADAQATLHEAAGPRYALLVGERNEIQGETDAPKGPGLIYQYETTRRAGKAAEAAILLDQIDLALVSPETSGSAARIIAMAQADKINTVEQAKSRYRRFAELLPEYRKSPEFFLARHWAEAREEILSSPLVAKVYITPGKQKFVLRISPDPQMRKEIQQEEMKLKK